MTKGVPRRPLSNDNASQISVVHRYMHGDFSKLDKPETGNSIHVVTAVGEACSLLVRTEFLQQMSKFRPALEASELWFSARLLGGVACLKCFTQVC